MTYSVFVIIATLLMAPGIIGILLPAMPGIPYMFLVALGLGFIDRFAHLSGNELALLAGIAIASLVVDYLAGILGAKFGGASTRATLAGLAGLIIGLFLFPPFGGFIGLFLGVLIVELRSGKEHRSAVKAASGSLIGSVAGIAINLVLALAFIITFLVTAWR